MRRGDPRRRGDNLGYSSMRNLDDRHHYDGGLFNYRRPERLASDWERSCERREISLIGRGRERRNNYRKNQRKNMVRDYNRLLPPVE